MLALPPPDRWSARERDFYAAGIVEGEQRTKPADSGLFAGRGLTSAEFLVTAWTTGFSTWVGYHVVMNPELDLQRAGTAVAANVAVAWYYLNKRTELKKAAAEAGTTTIKSPGAMADVLTRTRPAA